MNLFHFMEVMEICFFDEWSKSLNKDNANEESRSKLQGISQCNNLL